jgi:arabinose-5-phosphate isomerase
MTMSEDEWIKCAREVLDIEIEGLRAVRDRLDQSFVAALEMLAGCKGRVVVMGLGKSGLVGRKLAATLSSTGTPSFFMHPVEGAHGDMGSLRDADVVIAISNSGETDELNALVPAIQSIGLPIIAITGKPQSRLAHAADVTLNARVPREACSFNLAPTASTTAVLALGDALAVCLIRWKKFTEADFLFRHPGGTLGQRLRLKVESIMRMDALPLVSGAMPTHSALAELDKGGMGAIMIADAEGRLEGVLTDGDVRRALCSGRIMPENPVKNIMTLNPKTAQPDQSVAELFDLMEAKSITVLPVVDAERRPVGIVHMHDLLGKGKIRFSV